MQITFTDKDIIELIDIHLVKLKYALVRNVFFKEDLSKKDPKEALDCICQFPILAQQEAYDFVTRLFSDLTDFIEKQTDGQEP